MLQIRSNGFLSEILLILGVKSTICEHHKIFVMITFGLNTNNDKTIDQTEVLTPAMSDCNVL